FTQETTQNQYTVTLNLSSPDTDVVSDVPVALTIDYPTPALSLVNGVVDPETMVVDAILSNDGETLTDLGLQIINTTTGAPGPFVIVPSVSHAYMQTGDTLPIEIVPLSVTDEFDPDVYEIQATTRSQTLVLPIALQDGSMYALSQVCGASGAPETVAHTCIALPGEDRFGAHDWYCTNRPDIEITVPWTLNSQVPISGVSVGLAISNHTSYLHSTEVFLNNVNLGGEVVDPSTEYLEFAAPTTAIIAGVPYQTINLRSEHINGAHYVVGTDAYIVVRHGRYERSACYTPDEIADATALICASPTGDCQADLTASNLQATRDGNAIRLTARIGNGGTIFTSDADTFATFYDGDPATGANILGTVQLTQSLNPGEFEDVSLTVPIGILANPVYVVADDTGYLIGNYVESDEDNNVYRSTVYLTPDLSVADVDASGLFVNPHTLAASGLLAADVVSPVKVVRPFAITFFEDIDSDGTFTAADNILAVAEGRNLLPGIPQRVTAYAEGAVEFAGRAIYAFVDSDDIVIESDESNNIEQSVDCMASEGCTTALPDLIASYLRTEETATDVNLTVRIGNGGGIATSGTVAVTFYDDDPENGGQVLGTVRTSAALVTNAYEDVTLPVPLTTDALPIWVVADDTGNLIGEYVESDELNNIYRSNSYISDEPNQAPVVDAGEDIELRAPQNAIELTPHITDDNLPAGILDVEWSLVSGPADVIFSAVDDANAIVRFDEPGVYVLQIDVTDGELTASDDISIEYILPPVPQLYMDIPGCIASPAMPTGAVAQIDEPTPIVLDAGASTLTNVGVFYWRTNNRNQYWTLAELETAAGGDTVATFDTTIVANDTYAIQVTGTDDTGEIVACAVVVSVSGENKLGRVALDTTDFVVPIVGLPITIGRRYDSLERDIERDFGYGWSLVLGNPRLEVDTANNVTLNMPDGTRKTFYFAPPNISPYMSQFRTPNYISEPGEYGSFHSEGCSFLIYQQGQYFCDLGGPYLENLTSYVYEDPYGREYAFSPGGDIKTITDLNGNVLTFTTDGISSSAGLSVVYGRDAEGRITTITDPEGVVYHYEYDANGDLVAFYLPDTVEPVEYTYYQDAPYVHLLKEGFDPENNRVMLTQYDEDGRLQSITDAANNTVIYSYDVA
ncbi:MAG: hypothetical protein KC546_14170, partial [Anaerolineae bacterium]|nr:hypothetical protein [Anaerolineae bacterium]